MSRMARPESKRKHWDQARTAAAGIERRRAVLRGAVAAILACEGGSSLWAGPEGMVVREGQATAAATGNSLTIQVSDRALLQWQHFNIAPHESVLFQQPGPGSVVWNQILDSNPSSIFGRLEANGIVVLQNSAGFYFGPNSFVSAAGLFVTTTPGLPPDFAPGGSWIFNGPPPTASIVNYGRIEAHSGGSLFLIAEKIENAGELSAPGGQVGLMAGQEVWVSERPDGRGLSAKVSLPTGIVDNSGKIVADAGAVALHARVVNQGGEIQANTARERGGVIELVASERVELESTSAIQANGGAGAGDGGKIVIKSGGSYSDQPGSRLSVRGGAAGGDGGFVELSAPQMARIESRVEGGARAGFQGGSLLVDPTDIFLGQTGEDAAPDGTVPANSPPDVLRLDVNTAFVGFSRIALEAARDIELVGGTRWNLNESTGLSEPGSVLSLRAGRNLVFRNESLLQAGPNWSLELVAGADFANAGAPRPGVGSVQLLGTAGIEALDGSIGIRAGRDVTVASGFIRTIGGGDIEVSALEGNVNSGTRRDGFSFNDDGGYTVNLGALGGISTGAGGDVKITAGQDVASLLLTAGGAAHGDGGSGAFGAEPGNVTLAAGRDVIGHYVLRNGTGKITAGRDAGTQSRQLALSLVKGLWEVESTRDILLQEVRNPNGIFNNNGFQSAGTQHQFDYDLHAAVRLRAGNSAQLLGANLPRNPTERIPVIYPPSLSVSAGAGDVVFGNNLYLFPSPFGNLEIESRDGGAVRSSQGGTVFEIGMSDSSRTRWREVTDFRPPDPNRTLLHKDSAEPVRITSSGDIRDLTFFMPKRTEMRAEGNIVNTSLVAQNLRPTDVTRISAGGDIFNRNDWTFAFLEEPPDIAILLQAVEPPGSLINYELLRNKFNYNAETRRLGFQGRMTGGELNALLNIQVRRLGLNGRPIRDELGEFILDPAVFASEAILRDLFSRSQDVPNNTARGYQLGGPGLLEVTAENLDLGITEGILSHGPGLNPLLAQYPVGAEIAVTVHGNLSMFSSSIQSRAGANIDVYAGGSINVGSQEILASSEVARGIYSSREGDVKVVARGNIDVNGSRIASYSGGDVTVRSLEGNVDAGAGGVGFVRVDRVLVDPETGAVTVRKRGIPGSGILASTFPDSSGSVGNITVETPRGDIRAGQGGIAQVSFNGSPNRDGVVNLVAGTPASEGVEAVEGNIVAGDSGVIGGNIKLRATGDIEGVIVAQGDIDIDSTRNVNVTALASGNVSVSAVGNVGGTIVSSGSVDASGGAIDASLISQNVSASSASGVVPTADTGSAVSSTAQAAAATTERESAEASEEEDDDEEKRRRAAAPTLVRKVGRVTVILPDR